MVSHLLKVGTLLQTKYRASQSLASLFYAFEHCSKIMLEIMLMQYNYTITLWGNSKFNM